MTRALKLNLTGRNDKNAESGLSQDTDAQVFPYSRENLIDTQPIQAILEQKISYNMFGKQETK
jgi:hypothetical protein